MKLYYSPGACSMAPHIALREAGERYDLVRVDLRSHTTADGGDFYRINPKGYVPALALDDGEIITENIAILDWIADRAPTLRPRHEHWRTHLLEALAFISTELHKSFGPFFHNGSDAEKAAAGEKILARFDYLADTMQGDYLFGDRFSAADAYLFVMLRWAAGVRLSVPEKLVAYRDRIAAREAVREAVREVLAEEGLA